MQKIITVTPQDLHEGGDGFDIGLYARVSQRIESRNRLVVSKGGQPIRPIEERHMLIGEVGELIVIKDLLSRGLKVIDTSWDEFVRQQGYETKVDVVAHDGLKSINYQVKASEVGNRTIYDHVLQGCLNSPIDFLSFVAVRNIIPQNKPRYFEGAITSSMMPRHIPRLASWRRNQAGYTHAENAEFMKSWTDRSAEINSTLRYAR